MATYRARILDAVNSQDAGHDFDGPEDLMEDTPVRIVRAFFETADRSIFPANHNDWELNAAFKHRERQVVTCMGSFHFPGDEPPAPFLLMIARKP